VIYRHWKNNRATPQLKGLNASEGLQCNGPGIHGLL